MKVGVFGYVWQQHVVLARAITDPVVVIAQEPTGNMITADGQEFIDLLKRVTVISNLERVLKP